MNTNLPVKDIAMNLLKRSQVRVQMAAVLVDSWGVIGWGWNQLDGLHAEEHCLVRSNPRRISGSTLVLAGRRKQSGNLVYAYPCTDKKRCLQKLLDRGIRVVIYHDKQGIWYERDLGTGSRAA